MVTLQGRHIELTPTEEAVFYTLVRHAGKLVTCAFLLRCVWGTDSENKLHDLHVYIRNLRQKLHVGAGEILIQTEGSTGYRLMLPLDRKSATSESAPLKLVPADA
jgi:two-component system KDP operon response regulator KdpE